MSEEPSLSDLCIQFFEKELDAGYQITDRKSILVLRQKAMTTLKIKKGSNMITYDAINKVMQKRGIKLEKAIKEGGGIDVKFQKPLIESPTAKPSLPTSQTAVGADKPHGTLPKTETQQSTETKSSTPFIPNEQDKQKQKEIAKNGIGGIIQIIFERLAILEPTAKPKDEKEKLQKSEDLRNKIDSFTEKLGGTLYDKGIKLPKVLEYLDLGIEGYEAIVAPLLGSGILSSDEATSEKTPEEIEREKKLANA